MCGFLPGPYVAVFLAREPFPLSKEAKQPVVHASGVPEKHGTCSHSCSQLMGTEVNCIVTKLNTQPSSKMFALIPEAAVASSG